MLRICIPVHNEATTIGVLLWRLRSVFQGFSREYDVVVYDDASTDGTADVLEPYQSVMPLTVLRGATHRGYAGSIDALVRHVASDDEYARRDAMVLLQGDFTESPEHLPELVKRFEGGADLVAMHRTISDATPKDERRLRRWGSWAVKPFLRMPPVADPFTGFRLVRISVLRDLLKALGNRPVCAGEGWAANIDFALNVAPFARRIENVEFAPRYDVRQRASRRRGWADVVALFHWARTARSIARPGPGTRAPSDQPGRPEQATVVPASVERPARAGSAEQRPGRGGRPSRETSELPVEAPQRTDRPPREARAAREERALRGEERSAPKPDRSQREPRAPRPPRPEREPRAAELSLSVAPRNEGARPPRPDRTERAERPAREEPAARAERPLGEDRPAHGERPARPPRMTRDASESSDTPELPLIEQFAPDGESSLVLDGEDGEVSGTAQAGEKRKRRRRRSRRERAGRAEGGEGDGGGPDTAKSETTSGTSGSAKGEEDVGGDDQDVLESGEQSVEGATDAVRRKRRPRRRRRGRRPDGSADADAPDSSAPPAAEPPTA
ncbi:MAG TPA: glycosyltransferase [Gemmatimonadaceae bacterium]|nr:glycosyltransferase [Gemmatimonadaceae bacterium]